MTSGTEYWYNIATGKVEEGRRSSWTDVMGPYATREAAQEALDRAAARTEAWDEEDERRREG
ncbi:SPOR domain-containing protein [Cellulomonas sp. ATA003]|uniref:SPOR domain-containing protein n=1 Tax=Cellulomonas sp. ATA003 TaxID=3073064 RepID=UPI002872B245|nr:SPOR domain-containing protein [Cellulomonas sp. ATA003]WNB84498.1 SPOR domain-containing protein [Cellulomonas sp. ATA003]